MVKMAAQKVNNIGIDAAQPGKMCSDGKCPWHGHLKIRGRIFQGRVESSKAGKTAVVEWDYTHRITKFERHERRRSRITVYKPDCIDVIEGDVVRIGECRPISKTKKFVVIEKVKGL